VGHSSGVTRHPYRFTAALRATLTACAPGPRYVVHGTKGSFTKWGLARRKDQLRRECDPTRRVFGQEAGIGVGRLKLCSESGPAIRRVKTDAAIIAGSRERCGRAAGQGGAGGQARAGVAKRRGLIELAPLKAAGRADG